jgi:hypothetical protein
MADAKQTAPDLSPIFNWLAGIGGTRGSTSSSTSMDPRVRQQLDELFQTQLGQSTPEGAREMVGQIFKEGAKQVPVLGQQYANSVGARSGKNSPLAFANINLQTAINDSAVKHVRGLQTDAAATGRILADGTKTTSTSESKGQKKPALQLLPFLLGNAGKLKGAGKFLSDMWSDGGDTGFGSVTGGYSYGGEVFNNPSAFISGGSDIASVLSAGDAGGDWWDFGGGADFGVGGDASNWWDGWDTPDYSALGDLSGFVNGGSPGMMRKMPMKHPREMMRMHAPGYANGGPMTLGISTAGGPSRQGASIGNGANATLRPSADDWARMIFGGVRPIQGLVRGYADGGPIAIDTGEEQVFAGNIGGGAGPGVGGRPNFSNEVLGEDVVSYFADRERRIGEATSGFYGGFDSEYTGADGKKYWAYSETPPNVSGASDTAEAAPANTHIRQYATDPETDKEGWLNAKFDKTYNIDDGSYSGIAINRETDNGMGLFISWLATAASMGALAPLGIAGAANPTAAFARGMGTRALGNAVGGGKKFNPQMFGGTNKYQNSVPKGAGSSDGYADGGQPQIQLGGAAGKAQKTIKNRRQQLDEAIDGAGLISGPGTPTSDSIPIRTSVDEYIIPADVTRQLTPGFFDQLLRVFHTPVAGGK